MNLNYLYSVDLFEDLDEDIEKHDSLNPKLFTEDNMLREEVRQKIEQIVAEFTKGLAEDGIKIVIDDIIIIGSNVSYNYTKDSDLDVHIIADTRDTVCPDNLYPKLYSAYRSIFNKNHDISFYGIPVEIYVETDDTPRVSNGEYSVRNNEWIKEPVHEDIPDIDMDEFNKQFAEWEDRYKEIAGDTDIIESLVLEDIEAEEQIIDPEVTEESEAEPNDTEVIDQKQPIGATPRKGGFSRKNATRYKADVYNGDDIDTILNSTKTYVGYEGGGHGKEKRKFISIINKALAQQAGKKLKDFKDKIPYGSGTTDSIWHHVNGNHADSYIGNSTELTDLNIKNFVLIRVKNNMAEATSVHKLVHYMSYAYGGFAASAIKKKIDGAGAKFISVIPNGTDKDSKNTSYSVIEQNFMNWWEGTTAGIIPGKVLVDHALERIKNAKLETNKLYITEDVQKADEIAKYLEDIYELRHQGLADEGEYSMGNLIFKEVRNRGWLDNLKELQNEETSKDLSLETLAKAEAEFPLDEAIDLQDGKTRSEIRIKISQAAHSQPVIQDNGLFHIYNIREAEVNTVLMKLRNLDFIDQHYLSSTAGKFDFSHFSGMGQPQRYFTITGKIKQD